MAESALDLGVDITHPHRPLGTIENRCYCVENGTLPAANRTAGRKCDLDAPAESLT